MRQTFGNAAALFRSHALAVGQNRQLLRGSLELAIKLRNLNVERGFALPVFFVSGI